MPKQTRWVVKRSLDQADHLLDKAIDTIVGVAVLYDETHPDIFNTFSAIVSSINAVRDVLSQQRDQL